MQAIMVFHEAFNNERKKYHIYKAIHGLDTTSCEPVYNENTNDMIITTIYYDRQIG